MNKFRSQITEYNGFKYHSKKEAGYAKNLDMMKSSVDPKYRVTKWERQVKFKIETCGVHICDYILDFKVSYADGRQEYVDVKGLKKGDAYQIFVLKKKLVKAIYNIDIKEV